MRDSLTPLNDVVTCAFKVGADRADALWFSQRDLSLSCRKGKLEGLERSESAAITLRVFVGDSHAIASSTTTDADTIHSLAERAVAMARLSPPDPLCRFAPRAQLATTLRDMDLADAETPDADALFADAQRTEHVALSTPGITNSEGADASHSLNRIALAVGEAGEISFMRDYATSHTSLSVSVLAGEGVDMQRDYDFSTARHRQDLRDAADIGATAAQRALARLHPEKIASGKLPVIYDRRVSRQFLSTLAQAVNGSHIVRGGSFLKDALGQAVFAPGIRIIDDPCRPRGLASKPFDGEGVATKLLKLVEDGHLQSWLLDMRSATALGMNTTGHASRSMGSSPSPSSTNLYMEAGTTSLASLVGSVRYGLYITETFGSGANLITGDYSQGVSGFLIEHGVLTRPIAGITLAGQLRDMFARTVAADDLTFDYATNAPSLLIDDLAVAGT